MTELATIGSPNNLSEQMDYAKAVSTANLLPQAYRNKPADILIAVGLGQAMGLSPTESLYRIDVIQGKPTASAELIAANVRKAGHVLRLRVDEQAVTATCTIIRGDDPDYEHTVVRDQAWAQKMQLAAKDNYKKQPATMLGWRAVTACARMACPEALYGVAHTADEMADIGARPASTGGGLSASLNPDPPTTEQVTSDTAHLLDTTSDLARRLYAGLTDAGIDRDGAKLFYSEVLGREVASSAELTETEASACIDALPVAGEVVEEPS